MKFVKSLLCGLALLGCAVAQQAKFGGTGLIGGTSGWQALSAPTFVITTSSLPNATALSAYTAPAITTLNGTAPVTCAITGGALPTGVTINSSTCVISGTPSVAGNFFITVTATDSSGSPQTANRLLVLAVNCPPVQIISPLALPNATQGTAFNYQLQSQGGIGTLTWSLVSGSLDGLALSSTGAITGTPSVAGNFSPQISVSDTCPLTTQTASNTFSLHVDGNLAFTTGATLPPATVGVLYQSPIAAAGGTQPYGFLILSGSLPAGLNMNSAGVISGTPTATGTQSITVQVTDALSSSITQVFTITSACTPLVITSPANLPPAVQGTAYDNFQFSSTGGFGTLTWAGSGFPNGLSLSPIGALTGTPLENGAFTPAVSVTDSCPGTAQITPADFTMTVDPEPPPQISTVSPLPDGTVGQNYSTSVGAFGGTIPYIFTISNGFLPAGLVMSAGGVISGTPTTAQSTLPTVRVVDALGAFSSTPLSLTIRCVALSFLTNSPLPPATQGTAYSTQLQAQGGGGTLSFALTSGAFPTGVTMTTGGLISGTPSVAGTFNPVITVSDSCNLGAQSVPKTLTLVVSANTGALAISNSSPLPGGTVGVAYSVPITAVGGTTPYAFDLPSGTLPAGLVLNSNGRITGTPTTAQVTAPTVRVTDAVSATASKNFSLTINCSTFGVGSPLTLPPAVVGSPYSYQLQLQGGQAPYNVTLTGGSLPGGVTVSTSGAIAGTPTTAGTFSPVITARDSCALGTQTVVNTYSLTSTSQLTITTPSPLPNATVGVAYSVPLSAIGGTLPYTWTLPSGTVPAGSIDIFDYMIPANRANQHLTGATNKSTVLQAEMLWMLKGSTGNPWDGWWYDGQYIYFAFTENNDASQQAACTAAINPLTGLPYTSCFVDPYSYKFSTPGKLFAPRYFVPGSTVTLLSPPVLTAGNVNAYQRTTNCGVDAQPTLYLGNVKTVTSGPSNVAYGGGVGTQPTIEIDYYYSAGIDGIYHSRERFYMARGFGQVKWTFGNRQADGSYLDSQTSLNNNVVAGGAPTPNFACNVPAPPTTGLLPATALRTSGPPTFDLNSFTGVISGTPTTAGTSTFTVQVEDTNGAIAQKTFSLTVVCPALSISSGTTLPPATQGTAYSSQLTSVGGFGTKTWALVSGAFPTGVSVNSAGLISGTPSASGTFTATVSVTDSCSTPQTKQATFTMQVNSTAGLAIQTTSPLPAGVVGQAYSAPIVAVGGTAPYTYALTGSLPSGLALNGASGVISGTPLSATTASFTITVTDSAAHTLAKVFSLTINPSGSQADNRNCNPNETWIGSTTDGPAALPNKCVRTALSDTPATGPVKTVCASGCDFTTPQAAYTAAVCGWTIKIQSTSTGTPTGTQNVYNGASTAPATACPNSNWIIVETDQVSGLPTEGSRISPAWVGQSSLPARPSFSQPASPGVYLPQFVNSGPVLTLTAGASHWRFIGLEFTSSATSNQVSIINLGGTDHIILDRLVCHGGNSPTWQAKNNSTRCVSYGGSTYVATIDSYMGDIHTAGGDTQPIYLGGTTTTPTGPIKIVNNFLEGAGMCLFSGGGGNGTATLPSTDIEIRRNHCFKPLFWKSNDPTYFGTTFTVKNHIEFKNSQRVLIEGNFLDTVWGGQSDQFGAAINIGPKNQSVAVFVNVTVAANGSLTRISGASFPANVVSPLCAVPLHCRVKINGVSYQAQTFVDASHITVSPAPPTSASVSATVFSPGLNPSAIISDITIRYNKISHASRVIGLSADFSDGGDPGIGHFRDSIHDNIGDDIDGFHWTLPGGCCAYSLAITPVDFVLAPFNLTDLSYVHNTVIPYLSGGAVGFGPSIFNGRANSPMTNLTVRDNVGAGGVFLVTTTHTHSNALSDLQAGAPGFCFEGNVLAISTATSGPTTATANNPPYPAAGQSPGCPAGIGNFSPATYNAIQFTNLNGANGGNYQLLPGSPYHNAASDGTDPGANVNLVNTYTAGVN